MVDNPFDRYELDALEGIEAITQRLKERAEDATTDVERANLREAWEALTFHPAERLRAALFAYPETRAPLGVPPPNVRDRASTRASTGRVTHTTQTPEGRLEEALFRDR